MCVCVSSSGTHVHCVCMFLLLDINIKINYVLLLFLWLATCVSRSIATVKCFQPCMPLDCDMPCSDSTHHPEVATYFFQTKVQTRDFFDYQCD